jgi:RluA family pseudouridine synthase
MPHEFFARKSCFLNEFLAENLNISKTKAKRLLDDRTVFVNKRRTWIASFKLKPGDRIELTGAAIQHQKNDTRKINILYEDEQYLVVNKFPGILTNGEKSLETLLRKQREEKDLVAVHRLDKDTSGLVIFAKRQEFFAKIKELFQAQRVRKIYRALAVGTVTPQRFIIDTPLDGQNALTGVHVLKNNPLASYLELSLVTGRTHQIRLHLQKIGHPLIGEKLYVQNTIKDIALRQAPRQMLHAWQIEFNNPYTNKKIIVTEKEPEDFREMLKRLKILSGANI